MFGKPRDSNDIDMLDSSALDGIFGDEVAAANEAEVHRLQDRVEQVEAQISSQFTSLATYAQIAQEQVELARSESRAATERSEQRVMSLIERERADRITSTTAAAPVGSAPDIATRLAALEQAVAHLNKGLDDCRQQQRDLAHAVTTMVKRLTLVTATAEQQPLAPPTPRPVAQPSPARTALPGPIAGLALNS